MADVADNQAAAEDVEQAIVDVLTTKKPEFFKWVDSYGGELENEEDYRRVTSGSFPCALVMYAGTDWSSATMKGSLYRGNSDLSVFVGSNNLRGDKVRRQGSPTAGDVGIHALVRVVRGALTKLDLAERGVEGGGKIRLVREQQLIRRKNVYVWAIKFAIDSVIDADRDRRYTRELASISGSIAAGTEAGGFDDDGNPTGDVGLIVDL